MFAGKAVAGAEGVSCERSFCVKSIFELFLLLLSALRHATPGFRLSVRPAARLLSTISANTGVVSRHPRQRLWCIRKLSSSAGLASELLSLVAQPRRREA